MGRPKSENFFARRASAGGFTLAGLLLCLFTSQPDGRWYNIMLFSQSGSSLRIPWWPFIALFGAWPAARVFRWARARRLVNAGACPGCGYDLRCTPDRCPECGRARPLPTPDMSPVV